MRGRRFFEATVAIALAILFVGGALLLVRVNSVGAVSHDSLCAFKASLEDRIVQTEEFLTEHPEGFAGIPAATLQQSVDNQQRTVDALERGGLDCD
jgi:hypothetical protein